MAWRLGQERDKVVIICGNAMMLEFPPREKGHKQICFGPQCAVVCVWTVTCKGPFSFLATAQQAWGPTGFLYVISQLCTTKIYKYWDIEALTKS